MKFSIIFIVDYGKFEWQAICLAASIRTFVRDRDFEIIAYCPQHRIGKLENITKKWLKKLDVEIRPLDTSSNYNPAYPHGNKILACAAPRQTDYCLFMDTDMIFVRPTNLGPLFERERFFAARETNARWANEPELWDRLYAQNAPEAPRDLAVFSNGRLAPSYYNAGFFGFDDRPIDHQNRQRFGEIWRDISFRIDADPEISEKRPFLDQISLPVAAAAAGFTPFELSAIYNTHIRFEPEAGQDVRILHYHSNMHGNLLRESRYFGLLNQILAHHNISDGFAELVTEFLPVLDYVGVGHVIEIPVADGIRIGQEAGRVDGAHILVVFEGVYTKRPENLGQVFTRAATYGMVDVSPNLFTKKCRIIGREGVNRDASPEIWFWHDDMVEGSDITERWVWNTRNSWRAKKRPDIDTSTIPERKIEDLDVFLARCHTKDARSI